MKKLIWAAFILALVAVLLTPLATLATEAWWYQGAGYAGVFSTLLTTRVELGLAFGAALLVLLLINVFLARVGRPREGVWVGKNVFELSQPPLFQRLSERTFVGVSLVLAGMAGLEASSHWRSWMLLRHGGAFPAGLEDPLFGANPGFYVFHLPFLTYVVGWLQFAVVLAILATLVLHFYYRGVQLMPDRVMVGIGARRHLSALVALLLAVKAADYQLAAYGLVIKTGPLIGGATYADAHALLPGLRVLAVLSLLAAAAVLANGWLRGWKLSAAAIGGLILASVLGQGIIPSAVQHLVVAPNELNVERPYLERAIHNTRYAFALDRMEEKSFAADDALTAADVERNRSTIENIRLWDVPQILATYGQEQEIRLYYHFSDADNDRYMVDGRLMQTTLSPRELDSDRLQSRSWINEHLTYTHGFGICMGPVARISPYGLPEFYVKDLPPASSVKSLDVTQPRIYFGEQTHSYSLVDTSTKEFDYPRGDENVYTSYAGSAGVPIDSWIKRAAFFLSFGEAKILLSPDITSGSRMLYHREILDRAQHVTPWASYGSDAYMVVSGGRLYWILDGYTAAPRFPYSVREPVGDSELGYVRNSLKTVVDAYNGSVQVYVCQPDDPVVQAWSSAFPGVCKPLDQMPPDLRRHLRYPRALLELQAHVLGTYHMTDPQVFYNKEDVWRLPDNGNGSPEGEAYYSIVKLPGQSTEEFVLMVPFVPSGKSNMIAWAAARCDEPHYGETLVYELPKQKTVYGPAQVEAQINQDPNISQQVTLWNQSGSQVTFGQLLVIPMEQSLLYVQPLYLSASGGAAGRSRMPALKRVIVAFHNRIAMRETLEQAMASVFQMGAAAEQPTAPIAPGTALSPLDRLQELSHAAKEHLDRAESYQRKGNWAGYGEELKRLRQTLDAMDQSSGASPSGKKGK